MNRKENMFLTLMAVFLIGSTASYSSAHGEKTPNCSKTYTVRKAWQNHEIKKSDEVVCFKADSGQVRLQVDCGYLDCHDCRMHDFFKCCQPPALDVYDGCNVTAEKVDCKESCWQGMKWTSSEKTSCLTVVRREQRFKQSVNVWCGNAYREYSKNYRPCSKRLRFKVFTVRWRSPPRRQPKSHRSGRRQRRPAPYRSPPAYRKPPPPRTVKRKPPPPPIVREFVCNSLRDTIQFPNTTEEKRLSKVRYTYKIILPDENKRIRLIFRHVNLSTNQPCGSDYIEIYDGHVTWAKKEAKFCGNEYKKKPFISRSNTLKIIFVAERGKEEQKGFKVMYEPYQEPPERHYTNNKVTGVVIGTACGLVFLALTFLAICHSRRLILLHFLQEHDAELSCGSDVIQEKAPPSYDDVMASPEKYPVTPSSKRKEHHLHDIPENEDPPPYPGLRYQEEVEDNVPSYDVASDVSTEVERGEGIRETEANDDDNESQDRDVAEIDAGAEKVVKESDVSGTDVKESFVEEDDDEGVDERKENDTSQKYLESYAGIDVSLSQSKSHKVTSEEYSRAITTDV